MSTMITVLTLAIAMLVFLRERPRRKETRQIWALCALAGALGLLVPGGSFALQIVQSLMQGLLVGCCLLAVRKERISKERRAHFLHSRRRAGKDCPRLAVPGDHHGVGRCA
ncbi:hypothetical protein [Faecalispora anaeroviscerum]|uniref:hypothetical protein n=1 Tax=Faecalispora anaeroviscerum TaxID=2991836 RepID=UPI0024BB6E5A|nr:hypothetical protein [Faecalispora anaeroviscerum]